MKYAYHDNQKLFYGAIKQIRQKKETTLKNIKDENGNILTREEDIMERWREYFQNLLEEENNPKEREEVQERDNLREREGEERKITKQEFEKALSKMKNGKAPGHDEITTEMIKYAGESGTETLIELLNEASKAKTVPVDWQTGIITPLFKKGDHRECKNYRGITLLSIPGKLYARILELRIRETLENTIEESQCGFRTHRGTQDLIFTIRQISEKTIETGREVHLCFIDLEKAFDRIKREDVWKSLRNRGIDEKTIKQIESLYETSKSYVRTRNETSSTFETGIGLRQGCVLSPLLFSIVLDDAVKESKKEAKQFTIGNWKMKEVKITDLSYADDMVVFGSTEKELQNNMNIYYRELKKKT
jgi:hypothetical protein